MDIQSQNHQIYRSIKQIKWELMRISGRGKEWWLELFGYSGKSDGSRRAHFYSKVAVLIVLLPKREMLDATYNLKLIEK